MSVLARVARETDVNPNPCESGIVRMSDVAIQCDAVPRADRYR